MTVQPRRMRVAPSGSFIVDQVSGAGPLDTGDGAPGIVQRAMGIEQDPELAMTGAALLITRWRTPTQPAVPVTTLPFTLRTGVYYDVELRAPLHCSAAPVGNYTANLTARNLSTLLRETILTATVLLPALSFLFDPTFRNARFTTATGHDQLQLELTAAATESALIDLLSLRITEYAIGSF